jgi:hypothetical protein
LRSQLYLKEGIYKAPMPYPHLNPCTSGGMSMTIAPPGGPTQKRCLGPQVSLRNLVYLWVCLCRSLRCAAGGKSMWGCIGMESRCRTSSGSTKLGNSPCSISRACRGCRVMRAKGLRATRTMKSTMYPSHAPDMSM